MQEPLTTTSPRLLIELVGQERATIPDVLAARVAKTPDALAVFWQERRWGYADLWWEAERFAGYLAERLKGREKPWRVAVYLPKVPQALFAWMGTMLAGGIFVALNDAHKGALLVDLALRAKADLIITNEQMASELPPGQTLLRVEDWAEVTAAKPSSPVKVKPSDTAALLYTSGTTGRSKAVLLPHNLYCRGSAWLAESFGYRSDDVFHDWLPLAHIGGQLHCTMTAIMAGAALAYYPGFSRQRFWQEVRESGATAFSGFAALIKLLLQAPAGPSDRTHKLRIGLIGNMSDVVREEFEQRFGPKLYDTYGMSECEPLTLPCPARPKAGTSGRVCPDFEMAILDDEDRPLPLGKTGRVAIRPKVPDMMMQAYEGDEAATLAAWRNLWFHTQDLGRLDEEGYFTFVERLKNAIRRGGENIAAFEVETLLKRHPAVADCAVLGVPDEVLGQEVKVVVVRHAQSQTPAQELHRFAKGVMAAFMVPRFWTFAEALPYSDIGKVKREALAGLQPGDWDARINKVLV